ncbi:hypothetical protein GGQ86_004257 [Xanthobacter flavus]|uniref:Uncharacterized protein n=1 Tax=Xanthobacter flavus TaxID=281 RepID=A0A9W6CSN8_XANFL|nr:hypothetical protein [Xanthobacter flavus]MDR6335761.1 hypothetical protein [Xanthobacter flavus]GLI24562.1 hypothetical protein XFLAVUS301_42360 [Xanthobacter flavus]
MTPAQAEEMIRLRLHINALWEYLEKDVEAREALRLADKMADDVSALRKIISEQTKEASEFSQRYMAAVCAVGYASYFAIWTLTKESLTPFQIGVAGISGLISVAAYSIWTMGTMIFMSLQMFKYADLVTQQLMPDEFIRNFNTLKETEVKLSAIIRPLWVVFILISLLSILVGAVVLGVAFIRLATH